MKNTIFIGTHILLFKVKRQKKSLGNFLYEKNRRIYKDIFDSTNMRKIKNQSFSLKTIIKYLFQYTTIYLSFSLYIIFISFLQKLHKHIRNKFSCKKASTTSTNLFSQHNIVESFYVHVCTILYPSYYLYTQHTCIQNNKKK